MPKTIYQNDHRNIVARLKEARINASLSQIEVAQKLGKTQSYVSKIESGQRRLDIMQIKELAIIYKKNLEFFIK